jgi:hypothetical protein
MTTEPSADTGPSGSGEPHALIGHLVTAHGLPEPTCPPGLDTLLAQHQAALQQDPGSRRITCAAFLPGAGPEPLRLTVLRQAIQRVIAEHIGAHMVTPALVQTTLEAALECDNEH